MCVRRDADKRLTSGHVQLECACPYKNLLPATHKAGIHPPDSVLMPLEIKSTGCSYTFASLICRSLGQQHKASR